MTEAKQFVNDYHMISLSEGLQENECKDDWLGFEGTCIGMYRHVVLRLFSIQAMHVLCSYLDNGLSMSVLPPVVYRYVSSPNKNSEYPSYMKAFFTCHCLNRLNTIQKIRYLCLLNLVRS